MSGRFPEWRPRPARIDMLGRRADGGPDAQPSGPDAQFNGRAAQPDGRRLAQQLTRAYGTTYYMGAAFLPPHRRADVYGIYALCRLADDIVDEPDAPDRIELTVPPRAGPRERLDAFVARFYRAWEAGRDDHPLMQVIVATTHRLQLERDCFDRFFGAMRLDLTRTSWSSWPELRDGYMEGSAAVIGEMMLPVLEPLTPQAKGPARALGLAFQLTNFIRDVGEDLDRGRVYLPADELAEHGADPWLRTVTPQWRDFLAVQIERNRELYREAEQGLAMLPPASARCVGTALTMYSAILSRIEGADYDVFSERQRVRLAAKAAIAARVVATGRARTAPPFQRGKALPDRVAQRIPIRRAPQPDPQRIASTWQRAAVPRIERALALAQSRNPGGWYVVGAGSDLRSGPGSSLVRTIAGREIALWRTARGRVLAGPGACPHMGARLAGCDVAGEDLICRWHGLRLPGKWPGTWPLLPAHDDGVLLWVRLDTPGEQPRAAPVLPARPDPGRALATVYTRAARCEPRDIVANRLDPWHGAWLHPYAFSHLEVDETASTDECLVTDVTFRLDRTWGVPVRASFTCPDARSIVMTIVAGEGAGSVVETHATPLGVDNHGYAVTVLTEATIACSERTGFRVARALAPLVRPLVRRTQAQLWVDDIAYAERRYALRRGRIER